jgi:hypothetical protein
MVRKTTENEYERLYDTLNKQRSSEQVYNTMSNLR